MKAQPHKIALLGGTGFIGGHLYHHLTSAGHHVRVLTRRHKKLSRMPGIDLIQGDLYDLDFLTKQFADRDVVINLVGILNESGHDGRGFHKAHVEFPEKVVQACHSARIPRMLHMSALNADAAKGPSHYMRTKGLGEDIVHQAASDTLAVTSFRPSIIYGSDDHFSNRFARLLKLTPVLFPLACPASRFTPIFVKDIVAAYTRAIDNPETFGQRYNLCGPQIYTLQELVEYIAHLIGVRRRIIPLTDGLSRLQANIMEYFPGKPFSVDNYLTTRIDSVCDGEFPPVFDITPETIENVMPEYLRKFSK